jgi:hypothetical protein
MSIIRPTICKILATSFCIAVLAACAPVKTGDLDREHRRSGNAAVERSPDFPWGLSENYPDAGSSEEQGERLLGDVEPEPEQTKDQELQDLKRLGKWEKGVPSVPYSDDLVEYDFPVMAFQVRPLPAPDPRRTPRRRVARGPCLSGHDRKRL